MWERLEGKLGIILKFFSDNKDSLTAIGILLTFFVSVISLYFSVKNNKKAQYINTITKYRVEWLDELKKRLSKYISVMTLTKHTRILFDDSEERALHFNNIYRMKNELKLHLNSSKEMDKKIIDDVETLYELYWAVFEIASFWYEIRKSKDDTAKDSKVKFLKNKEVFAYFIEKYPDIVSIKDISSNNIENFICTKDAGKRVGDELSEIVQKPDRWEKFEKDIIELQNKKMVKLNEQIEVLINEVQKYVDIEWSKIKEEARGKV